MNSLRSYIHACTPVCLITLATPLDAQIAPSGYEHIEGEGICLHFGSTPYQRFQLLEGEASKQLLVMRRIGFRLDDTATISNASNEGRTWTRVTIDMARTQMSKITTTFASNYVGAGSRVFDAKFSFPTYFTNSATYPSPFTTQLSYPLRRSMVFRRQEFLVDWHMYGGTLGRSWPSQAANHYFLDAARQAKSNEAIAVAGRIVGRHCESTATMNVSVYGENIRFPKAAGTMLTSFGVHKLPQNTPSIQALTIGGSDGGTPIRACNRLHANLSNVLRLFTGQTNNGGNGVSNVSTRYQPSFHGVRLYTQAAYAAPRRGNLMLSKAGRLDLPPMPGSRSLRRASVYTASPNQASGLLRWNDEVGGGAQVPIVRYSNN